VRFNTLVIAAIFGGLMAASLSATTIGLWSTGVCFGQNTNLANCVGGVAGGLLNVGANDNNYQYIARIDGGTTGVNSSATNAGVSPGTVGGYVPNDSGSLWIGPTAANNTAAPRALGAYTIQTTFDLTGFVASTLVLSMDVAVDNYVQILVNGHDVTSQFAGGINPTPDGQTGAGLATCAQTSATTHAPPAYCFEGYAT